MDKGEEETSNDNEDEDTQNPLDQPMDAIPSVETQAPIVDDAGLKEVRIETDAKDKRVEERDTVDDVKDFLEKDKQIFDDLALSQGPINLDSLSPI